MVGRRLSYFTFLIRSQLKSLSLPEETQSVTVTKPSCAFSPAVSRGDPCGAQKPPGSGAASPACGHRPPRTPPSPLLPVSPGLLSPARWRGLPALCSPSPQTCHCHTMCRAPSVRPGTPRALGHGKKAPRQARAEPSVAAVRARPGPSPRGIRVGDPLPPPTRGHIPVRAWDLLLPRAERHAFATRTHPAPVAPAPRRRHLQVPAGC